MNSMNTSDIMYARLSRRGFGAITVGAIGAAALAGPSRAVAQGETGLTMWGEWSGEGEAQIRVMVDAFNAAHPGIRLEYVVQEDMITKFLTGATSGMVPDIMIWDRWQTSLYAPRGVLAPINDYMSQAELTASDFYEEAVRELTSDDQVYGLPLTVDARALFYNAAHLTEAGIQSPTTWDELAAAAVALTKRDGDMLSRAGLSLGDVGLFSMYHRQAGGEMLTEDNSQTAFNNEQGLSVLNYWKGLMDQSVYELGFESGLGEGQDAFVTGKVSMHYTGPWMLSTYQKYGADLEFGVVPPVAGPNGDLGGVMGGFGLVITQGSQNKDAAWEVLRWWLGEPANAKIWGETSRNIPGNRAAAQDPVFSEDPHIRPVLDTLEFAKIRPPVAGYSPMEIDALIPNLQLFMEGKQSAEETLAKAQEDGDRILAENNL